MTLDHDGSILRRRGLKVPQVKGPYHLGRHDARVGNISGTP